MVIRGKAVESIEYKVEELDNIFGILVLDAFIGIPSAPVHITMALFPLSPKSITGLLGIKAYIGKYSEVFVEALG
jgi:hypothetical protein